VGGGRDRALLTTVLAFATIASVAVVKRLLIGTFEPTVQPLWCRYVWNNEIINGTYEAISESTMPPMLGTPFASMCMRWMGCKIGKWVFLETPYFSEFDLVEIGDHAALNLGATIQTHLFEDRVMKADYLRIGAGCTVANLSVVLYGTHMQRGSSLGPLSLLMKGEMLPAGSSWSGIPSEAKDLPPARARPLTNIRLRRSGDAVRRWAAQYTRALAAFAAPSKEPGFQERIHSAEFRHDSCACASYATNSNEARGSLHGPRNFLHRCSAPTL